MFGPCSARNLLIGLLAHFEIGRVMGESWANRIAAAYGLRLDDSLRAWFDEAWWARRGSGEFASALSPQQILEPDGEIIWPGLLPPDLLPILGNDYGDWICLRVGLDNLVTEIVYWNHGGGDWIPYGPNLPEALLYLAAQELAGLDIVEQESLAAPVWVNWAREQLAPKKIMPFWEPSANVDAISALTDAGVARTPVGRDICLRRLQKPMPEGSERRRARELGVAWEPEFISWLFDLALAPEVKRGRIWSGEDEKADFAQDWLGVEIESLQIERVRPNLGWPLDLAGWAAERRGDYPLAIGRYWSSLGASVFSDEAVRFRKLWFSEGFGKFAAARLWELRDHLSPEQKRDPYLLLLWENDRRLLRFRVSRFWLEQAERAIQERNWAAAIDFYLRGGWDVGMPSRSDYVEVLEGIRDGAQRLGSTGLARLAAIHLRILEAKFQ